MCTCRFYHRFSRTSTATCFCRRVSPMRSTISCTWLRDVPCMLSCQPFAAPAAIGVTKNVNWGASLSASFFPFFSFPLLFLLPSLLFPFLSLLSFPPLSFPILSFAFLSLPSLPVSSFSVLPPPFLFFAFFLPLSPFFFVRSRTPEFYLESLGSAVISPSRTWCTAYPKSNLVHYSLKLRYLVTTIFIIFLNP